MSQATKYNNVRAWTGRLCMPLAMSVLVLLCACDNIAEDDRLIYEAPAAVNRSVLIEDFTGQRCVNCPNAADEIHSLQQEYGDSIVVAVAIHGGPMAVKPNPARPNVVGLATDLGDAYHEHWKVEQWPMGMVNRSGICQYTDWKSRVREQIALKAPVNITATFSDVDGQPTVGVETMGLAALADAKLQVWLVEDSIIATQLMPDGKANAQYLHRHVFRAAVNGEWGTDLSVAEGQVVTSSFPVTLSEVWQRNRLAAVVFVYDDSGVLQVTSAPLAIGQE